MQKQSNIRYWKDQVKYHNERNIRKLDHSKLCVELIRFPCGDILCGGHYVSAIFIGIIRIHIIVRLPLKLQHVDATACC